MYSAVQYSFKLLTANYKLYTAVQYIAVKYSFKLLTKNYKLYTTMQYSTL